MAYDFQAAIAAAQAVVNRANGNGEGGVSYKYPLVYPAPGNTYIFRLLYNPKSGQIVRLINRHEKIPCYRTYGIECPICKVMDDVKNVTGADPFGRTKASKSRGISFAKFISSTIPHKNGDTVINPGETVLLMFPWSVYTQLNSLIQACAQTPTGMDQAFCHADTGLFVQIKVSNDGQYKYETTAVPYMTFATGKTDEQFLNELDEMESLNEQVVPGSITQEVDAQVKEYADAIYRQYIVPRTPNQAPQTPPMQLNQVLTPYTSPAPATTQSQNTPYNPSMSMGVNPFTQTPPTGVPYNPQTSTVNQVVAPIAPAPQQNSGSPACFGKHQPGTPQCICCPVEAQCMEALPFN